MSIKALFIANAIMFAFAGIMLLQSFQGMNSTALMDEMHRYGLVKPQAEVVAIADKSAQAL